MFFILSKVLGFFALPSNLLIALALAGVVLMPTRFARAGRRLAAAGVVLLALCGLSPLGNWLLYPLETRFPPWAPGGRAPDGIVVLGGAINPEIAAARGTADLNEAAERVTAVADLARRYPQARILYSGGNGQLVLRGGVEAEQAVGLLESFGIARGRVELEGKSRNTVENAVFSHQIAAPRPGELWLLVTSAYHMPRAIGVFRQAGFAVAAYPVDWRTRGPEDLAIPFISLTAGLRRLDTAAREWAGLVVYRLTGRSEALFPAP